MSDTIRIKPRAGLIVRDPVTFLPLAVEGEVRPRFDQYWQRRLRDGDVELVPEEPPEDDATGVE
jgi:hypothetical protein